RRGSSAPRLPGPPLRAPSAAHLRLGRHGEPLGHRGPRGGDRVRRRSRARRAGGTPPHARCPTRLIRTTHELHACDRPGGRGAGRGGGGGGRGVGAGGGRPPGPARGGGGGERGGGGREHAPPPPPRRRAPAVSRPHLRQIVSAMASAPPASPRLGSSRSPAG